MRIVKGNKTGVMSAQELADLAKNFEKVVYDIGTGDGRYVYKKALENPKTLFVGIDPSEKQMQIYSKKAVKEHLRNAIFVIGSIEVFPIELEYCADEIVINLPWGSLLKEVVEPSAKTLATLANCYKPNNGKQLRIIFGFNPELEPSETERLALEKLDENKIKTAVVPLYLNASFENIVATKVSTSMLKDLETTWGKKLQLTHSREMFVISTIS